jgi:hypothetical protein
MPAIGHLGPSCTLPRAGAKIPRSVGEFASQRGRLTRLILSPPTCRDLSPAGGGVMPSSQVNSARSTSDDKFHLGKSRCNIQCAVRNPQGHPPSNPIGYLSSLHCSPNPAACLLRREAPEAQSAYRKSPRPAVKIVKSGLARASAYRALRLQRAAWRGASTAHGLFQRPAVAFRHGNLRF